MVFSFITFDCWWHLNTVAHKYHQGFGTQMKWMYGMHGWQPSSRNHKKLNARKDDHRNWLEFDWDLWRRLLQSSVVRIQVLFHVYGM